MRTDLESTLLRSVLMFVLCLKSKPLPLDACLHGLSPGTTTSKSQQQEHLCRVHTDIYTASQILGFHTLGEKRHSVLCKVLAVAHSPWGPIHKSYLDNVCHIVKAE